MSISHARDPLPVIVHCCFVTFVRAKKKRLKNMQRQRKIVPCDRGQEDRLQGFAGYCAVLQTK